MSGAELFINLSVAPNMYAMYRKQPMIIIQDKFPKKVVVGEIWNF